MKETGENFVKKRCLRQRGQQESDTVLLPWDQCLPVLRIMLKAKLIFP